MKPMKKVLSLILTLIMVLSLVPFSAFAADMGTIDKNQSVALDTSKTYKVFHLDCGRKYFSVDQIKAIIDTMSANDYNYLELAIGNDGLRFLLDDMSVTANGTTYSSANVTAGIKAGNKAYCDCGTNELTQAEMDEIIAYAKTKSISIIPLLNSPGHMDAILTCMKQVGISNPNYSTSVRTVDITNGTAADFTLAFVNKYIQYFAGKGCEIFNMGADEFANDIQSQPQFAGLISSRKYGSFVNYVNNMAAQIQNAGMVPMAFNDGIYYNQNTSYGTFDQNIVVSYWSSGWSGYNVAPASFLYNKGHKILNTNGNWYYVLNAANGTSWDTAKSRLQSTPYDSVQGSTVPVVGAMVCYWCDTPSYSYSSTEQQHVQDMITTFAAANPAVFDLNKETTEPENPGTTEPGGSDSDATKAETINLKVGESTTKNINGANYAGTYTPDPADIAIVTVTGKDKVDATQTETVVTSISTSSSYYIKSSDGKYLNASGEWVSSVENAQKWTPSGASSGYLSYKNGSTTTYLRYNNGWTTTTSTNNRTTLYFNNGTFYRSRSGNAWFGYTYTDSLGYPVTMNVTEDTPASTTITFTGNKAGTTYVTIGDTKYTINVTKKIQDVPLTVGGSTTVSDTTASTAKSADTSVATVSTSGNNLTIKGIAVGNTTVETDTTIYNVTVAAEDLSKVNTTIEFWITNRQVTANNATSMTLNAGTSTVYSENGAAIADLVPETGAVGNDNMVFWKAVRLASNNKQTTGSGVDKTLAGTDFTRIRYYNGSWAYFDGSAWTNFATGDQIVAYYLQKTDVTIEVETQVVDWGPVKANWKDLNYLNTKYVLLDYSVKYETGEEVPTTFTNEKTLAFHCDTSTTKNGVYYRTIGMTRAVESADYEVYMITATPTSDSTSKVLASTAAGNGTIAYSGTEKVVWAETQADLDNSGLGTWTSISGKFTYSIGGDPIVPGMEIYRQQGMKITYYVRAKITDDALTVNYVNQTTGENFYNYNIAVKSGTVFDAGIALANPWKANLKNGSVANNLGKTQTVSADLSTMPAIGVSYRYSQYTCTKAERSADGKTVTLYYTFNNEHKFVADFGLPLKITTADLGISGDWTSATVTNAKYGTATAVKGQGVTYTPTTTLKGVEQLSLNLTNGNETTTQIIYIYPATTVYYEEGFATMNGFSAGSKGTGMQTTSAAKTAMATTAAVYGYDAKYASEDAGASNGTQAESTAKGDNAVFTFTGTGVDIYANTSTNTGMLFIKVKNSSGTTVKNIQVDTVMKNGSSAATDKQNVTAYNVPVATIKLDARDTYSVTITHIVPNSTATVLPVMLDGFRVYGTISEDNEVYAKDLEENPVYIELRKEALAAYNVNANGVCEQVYGGDDTTVSIVSNTADYSSATVQDILKNGPKNEIYLQPNQTIVFNVNTDRQVQLGMKALNTATSYSINNGTSKSISSSTDMFYAINNGQVTVKNTGSGILSITKIKICDDPSAALSVMTADDVTDAINNPVPEVKYADATLTVYVNGVSTVLTANGVEGETYTFTAAEIKAAAESLVEDGYELKGADFSDVEVTCGNSDSVSFTAVEKQTNTSNSAIKTIINAVVKVLNSIKSIFGK